MFFFVLVKYPFKGAAIAEAIVPNFRRYVVQRSALIQGDDAPLLIRTEERLWLGSRPAAGESLIDALELIGFRRLKPDVEVKEFLTQLDPLGEIRHGTAAWETHV